MAFTTGQEGEEFDTNLSSFKDFVTLNFVKTSGFRIFLFNKTHSGAFTRATEYLSKISS